MAILWLTLVLAGGLLLFSYRHLEAVVAGERESYLKPLISELSSFFGAGVLFFGVRALVRRWPFRGPRSLPLYGLGLLVFSGLHTSLNWGLRALAYPLVGLGAYDYGRMPLRYAMEFPIDLIAFTVMVGALEAAGRLRAARQRELERAQLEGALARAQLTNLRLQLQPHFLFNALNTISATMYDDPAAADEMLDRLAELLRASLRTAQTAEVPLAVELDLLASYLAIQRARFGERLVVTEEIAAGARQALVPSLFLQPLVENAIRHGRAEHAGQGRVAIRAWVEAESLLLEVENDLAAEPAVREAGAAASGGLGLASTAERLRLLYGEAQSCEAGEVEGGLFRVRIALPWHSAETPPP